MRSAGLAPAEPVADQVFVEMLGCARPDKVALSELQRMLKALSPGDLVTVTLSTASPAPCSTCVLSSSVSWMHARGSTVGQTLDAQLEQLAAAGCTKIYREKATGTRMERHAEAEFRSLADALTKTDASTGQALLAYPEPCPMLRFRV